MANQTHTKGKWYLEGNSNDAHKVNFPDVVKCEGLTIAEIAWDCNYIESANPEEAAANAKLIVAAPELLAALLKVSKDAEQGIILPSTKKLIELAIEKVTK